MLAFLQSIQLFCQNVGLFSHKLGLLCQSTGSFDNVKHVGPAVVANFMPCFFSRVCVWTTARGGGGGGRGGGGLKTDALPTTSTEPNNGDSTVPIEIGPKFRSEFVPRNTKDLSFSIRWISGVWHFQRKLYTPFIKSTSSSFNQTHRINCAMQDTELCNAVVGSSERAILRLWLTTPLI